jgi:CHAT domain-containing protein/Tfp pilus assembly protein PilF
VSRVRNAVPIALLCGVLVSASAAVPQPQDDVPTLAPGKPLEREYAGGKAHAFMVDAQAGEFLRLAVEQRGINLVVALLDPKGQPMLEVDASPGPRGVEALAWIAEVTGAHRIEVRPHSSEASTVGSYSVRLDEPSLPTPDDRNRAAAETRLSEGLRLAAEPKAESRRSAVEMLETALPLWRSVGDRKKEAATLLGLGRAALNLSDVTRATAWLEEALALSRAEGDRALEAEALGASGEPLYAQGLVSQALERFEASRTAWQEVGSVSGEAIALSNVGVAYVDRWDQERGMDAYERALVLFRALGDRKNEATALANLGMAYDIFGNQQKAIELLREALPLHRALGNRRQEANVLNNLGSAYQDIGDPELGLEYLRDALPIYREVGDRRGEATAVHNMAFSIAAAGDLERARTTYQESLELRRAVGDKRGAATTLLNLGGVYRKAGDRAKAFESLEQALALAREIGSRFAESTALLHLARLKAEAGDLEGARARCVEAISVVGQIRAPKRQALALYRLAWIDRARGDLAAAKEEVEKALGILEAQRARFSSADFRAAYVATVREIYELHVDVLMQLHRKEPGRGFDALAFQASERARSRSLLELLAEARADVREGVAPDLVARERSLRNRLNAAAERRLRTPPGLSQDAASGLDREIEGLTSDLGRTEAEIRATSPRYAALTQPSVLSPSDVQALLGTDTLLLEYFLGEERSFVWLLTGDSFVSHELPSRAAIEAVARRAYQATSQATGDWEGAAAELSEILLGPVADRLPGRRLVFVADGALQYVPFAALPRPGGKEPLVARQEIVGLPSASTLPLLRQERPGHRQASKTLAVLADPVFDAEDARVRGAGSRGHDRGWSLSRATADLGLGGPIPRLPFSRREARAIVAGIGSSRLALDFEASQATVTDSDLEQYRFVHFATHGFMNSAHPELSGLVLSLVDGEGRAQDGFLTTARIFNLRLAADLVVLSGCRTALGKEIRGEGLVGMTRGFMYAGAPRVVASLWQVDDAATAELMVLFYRGLRGGRASAVASLREAQLSLMRQSRFRHPYYWAAFQLQGEWR